LIFDVMLNSVEIFILFYPVLNCIFIQMNKTTDSLDHVKFDPKYNLQMMFELLVEIIALQQATNKVLTERLYGEEAILVEDEIIKACADLKPRIMESLYVQFGKTPIIKPPRSKPKPKSRS
jgi:hypothetical protein